MKIDLEKYIPVLCQQKAQHHIHIKLQTLLQRVSILVCLLQGAHEPIFKAVAVDKMLFNITLSTVPGFKLGILMPSLKPAERCRSNVCPFTCI
jgi:hypothetical protein